MDLRELTFFVAVAEELHFAKAAARCNTTQSVVSRQLKRLEDELGVELLARTTRDVRLTRQGALFLKEARRLLRHAERARASAAAVARNGVGYLSVGFTPASGSALVAPAVRDFRAGLPGVSVELVEMGSLELEAALAEERLDCAILHPSGNACALDAELIGREPMRAVVAPSHPLARRRTLRVTDLADEDLIFYRRERAGQLFDDFIALLRRSEITPRPIIGCSSFGSALTAAASGLGIAFLPRSLCIPPNDPVRFIPFSNDDLALTHVFARRAADRDDPLIQQFLSSVLKQRSALEAASVPRISETRVAKG